jgi:chromosome segregation ATPase
MELAVKSWSAAPVVKEQVDMPDTQNVVLGVLGSGALTTLVGYVINRNAARRKDEEAAYTARMAEAISIRDSDRKRLTALEEWRTNAEEQIAELRGNKLELEAQVYTLRQQIADMHVQISTYQKNEIDFKAQISALNEMLAAKKGELRVAEKRLEAIKNATPEELRRSLLYQQPKDYTESDNGHVEEAAPPNREA